METSPGPPRATPIVDWTDVTERRIAEPVAGVLRWAAGSLASHLLCLFDRCHANRGAAKRQHLLGPIVDFWNRRLPAVVGVFREIAHSAGFSAGSLAVTQNWPANCLVAISTSGEASRPTHHGDPPVTQGLRALKTVLLTILLFTSLFWLLCEMEGPKTPPRDRVTAASQSTETDLWRRTAAGWELKSSWQQPEPRAALWFEDVIALHPAVIASLQILISLAALLVWEPPSSGGDRPPVVDSPSIKQPLHASQDVQGGAK